MRIAAAKQPGSEVTACQPWHSMVEPLRVAVGAGQLQLSLWEHERRSIPADNAPVSRHSAQCWHRYKRANMYHGCVTCAFQPLSEPSYVLKMLFQMLQGLNTGSAELFCLSLTSLDLHLSRSCRQRAACLHLMMSSKLSTSVAQCTWF